MKIMFAVATYWPSLDGVAVITKYLAEGLAKKGHEVLVFTSERNDEPERLKAAEVYNGVQIERMRVFVRWPVKIKGKDENSTPQKYFDRVCSFNPDVLIVVCSQIWTLDWIIPYLDQIDCKKVFYSHGYSAWYDKYDYMTPLNHRNIMGVWRLLKMKWYYDKLYYHIEKFDLAVYLSEKNNSVTYAEKYGLTNGWILENAIDDRFFDADMQHKYDEKKEEIIFLYVANYNQNKNQEMLLRAYAQCNIEKSKLIFVGNEENDYLEYLKELEKESLFEEKQKKIIYGVHLDREEIYLLYKEADVFVIPSKSETWSIVAHEAAASGIPIISTDVGVCSEIEGSIIVYSEEEMKIAMEELAGNVSMRREKGQLAKKWVNKKQCRIEDKVNLFDAKLRSLF